MEKIIVQSLGYGKVPIFARKLVFYYGLAGINWAKLEQQLDMLLHTVNHRKFDLKKYRETPNTSFDMKCDLFKKWFVQDPRFKEVHDISRRLHKSLKTASKDRQLLFHSSVQEFVRGDPNIVKIFNLRHDNKKEEITVTKGTVGQDTLEGIAVRLARLTRGMQNLSKVVMNEEFLQSLEIAESQIQRGTGLVHHTKRIVYALARRLGLGTSR